MPNRFQIAVYLALVASTYGVSTYKLRKKSNAHKAVAILTLEHNDILRKQMDYLLTKLDENDLGLDEFDRIILQNLITE